MKYVDLLTIDDWMKADPKIRLLILQNIKLRERLWSYPQAQLREGQTGDPTQYRLSLAAVRIL